MSAPGSAALQAQIDEVPVYRGRGCVAEVVEEGVRLTVTFGPTDARADGSEVTHGGVVATLLDTAATFAMRAAAEGDWMTVDLRVDYLRPTMIGKVVATGSVVRAGRSVGRARAEVVDGSGKVCATATGTFVPASR